MPRKTTNDKRMTRSIWPKPRRSVNSQTPSDEPIRPPTRRTKPILKSTLPRRQWASTPETDDATIWFAWLATATGQIDSRKGIVAGTCGNFPNYIGSPIKAGEAVCVVGGVPVPAAIDGIVRGCVRAGTRARAGLKLGDVDPRGLPEYCVTVSEKARALGGAVLEVVCGHLNR